jgi:hypothetical protein
MIVFVSSVEPVSLYTCPMFCKSSKSFQKTSKLLFDRFPFINTLDMPNITHYIGCVKLLKPELNTPRVKRRLLGSLSLLLHKKGIELITHFKI